MENINQINSSKKTLDFRNWWKQITKASLEYIIDSKAKWNYWLFNEDKTRITTIENWKISNYKTSETEILLNEETKKFLNIKEGTESEALTDLFLSPETKVKDTSEAYEKAKYSNKTPIFWFITKGDHNKAVVVLDFSQWKKPKIKKYSLDKYNLKMKAIKI